MLAHLPDAVGGHGLRVPIQPVSTYEQSDALAGAGLLRTRRSQAFMIGEAKARRREISADAYLFLYKELVGLAGDRTYCWPGLDFLVEKLGASEGTLKRWIKELEKAELIQRKPRPGGQTSLTYITVFLDSGTPDDPDAIQALYPDDADEARHTTGQATSDPPQARAEQSIPSALSCVEATREPVFFGPKEEINIDRCAGSDSISHTFKSQESKNLNGSGGCGDQQAERDVDDAVVMLLKDEAVLGMDAIVELQRKPLVELQALSQYLDKQTNARSRPGLFVWLARQDFGAQLLSGRQRREAGRVPRPSPAEVKERDGVAADRPNAELAELWQRVLDQVGAEAPRSEFATWLQPTRLLELEANDAVVATPNIFVRQQIEACFLGRLTETLRAAIDRPVQVHVVVEAPRCST